MNRWLCVTSVVLALGYGGSVLAQEAASVASDNSQATAGNAQLTEVIVTGTRQKGMRAEDSAQPIQILGPQALATVGQPNLINALAQNAPSLQAQPGGSDLAGLNLEFRLRGLSPNHTLVLVNGKRRHTTASVSVGLGPFQTGAGVDLSFIPVDAIDHVEILQNGAAAQYGTDAIAGVVNIILKKQDSGGNFIATGGQYYAGDGDTGNVSFNLGLAPTDGAWINLTGESRYHGHSYRLGLDPRVTGTRADVFPTVQQNSNYPYVAISAGDALIRNDNVLVNFGYNGNEAINFYGDASYGQKNAFSYEGFRTPNVAPSLFPNGFTPQEDLTDNDWEVSAGLEGVILDGWNYDVNSTFGRDNESVRTLNTANQAILLQQCAALYGSTCGVSTNGNTGAQSVSATGNFAVPGTPFYNQYATVLSNPLLTNGQTSFYDGGFSNSDWTNTLDISRAFGVGLASPLNLAFGGEARHENYQVRPGERTSYFGTGAQGFPGFSPANSGSYSRDNYAGYIDLAVNPIEALNVDVAGRHEHFSDFGSTTIGKFTTRFDFNSSFAVRGTVSTGFRAPTLAEERYSATSVSTSSATVQLPANSQAAELLGIGGLKPEKTHQYSVGFIAQPITGLAMTLDAYEISIRDRIVGSGTIYAVNSSGGATSSAALAAINALGLQFPTLSQLGVSTFYNGADTRTEGVDFTTTYNSNLGRFGTMDWNASANYNETKITRIAPNPAALAGIALLSPQATSALVSASPRFEVIGGPTWTLGKFSANLREAIYGPSWVYVGLNSTTLFKQQITTRALTNLELSYQQTRHWNFAVGAENLFNTYPNQLPKNYVAYLVANNNNATITPYPIKFSPFGFNGGYYYAKVSFTF